MENAERRWAVQLVFYAAAVLYFELGIIRFTAAEVLYMGFFSNFILISVFVGLGLGFLAARRAKVAGQSPDLGIGRSGKNL